MSRKNSLINKKLALFLVGAAVTLTSACQASGDNLGDSPRQSQAAVVYRPDLVASFNLPSRSKGPVNRANDELRIVIPIASSGQVRLGDIDNYLRPLVKTLADWPLVVELKVIGHSDSEGSELSNMLLSLRRANAVAERLEELGVEAGLMRVEAYGETKPIADNTSLDGRIANRRVEVLVLGEYREQVSKPQFQSASTKP